MRTISALIFLFASLLSKAEVAKGPRYITSFVGDYFSLNFPTPLMNGPTIVFRDARWAVEVLEVNCDGKAIQPHAVEPAGISPMPTDTVADVALVYSLRSSEFIVCQELNEGTGKGRLVEYRLPADFTKIVVKYRIRLPSRGFSTEISTMTAYLRPLFPAGREPPEDQRRG